MNLNQKYLYIIRQRRRNGLRSHKKKGTYKKRSPYKRASHLSIRLKWLLNMQIWNAECRLKASSAFTTLNSTRKSTLVVWYGRWPYITMTVIYVFGLVDEEIRNLYLYVCRGVTSDTFAIKAFYIFFTD